MSIAVFAIRRFDAGRIEVTPRAEEAIDNNDIAIALLRHTYGDWGLVPDEDRLANEFALEHQLRLLSVYEDSNGKRFWIITEADRSATTVLLPEES
jgi:hypothetical protein